MLNKQDLQAIDGLIKKRTDPLEKGFGQLRSEMNQLEERLIEKVEEEIESSNLEIQKEMFLLKAELKRELSKLDNEVKKGFKKSHENQNVIIKHFNEEVLRLRGKVEDLEQKVGIPNLS